VCVLFRLTFWHIDSREILDVLIISYVVFNADLQWWVVIIEVNMIEVWRWRSESTLALAVSVVLFVAWKYAEREIERALCRTQYAAVSLLPS
jgi:hypothetical protein